MLTASIQREHGGDDKAAPAAVGFKTEFHQFQAEIIQDLERITPKYPLITLISMVACCILGFFSIFSFSPTNILSGVILMSAGGALAKSIKWNELGFWNSTKNSVACLFSAFSATRKT